MAKKVPGSIQVPSARSEDQPATRKMLYLVRDELKSEIRSNVQNLESKIGGLEIKMDGRFDQMDAKFDQMDAKFDQMGAKFDQMDAKFDQMDAKFGGLEARTENRFAKMEARIEEMRTDVIRVSLLFEEQNANNRIVLEGLQALWQRQDRIESKLN